MHNLYKKDKVTIDISNAVYNLESKVMNGIKDIVNQNILNTATWFLSQKEKELGIANDTDDINIRRIRVLSKNLSNGKSSVDIIKEIVSGFGINADISVNNLVLTIELKNAESNTLINYAKKEIDEIAPAHLLINYVNYTRTHDELKRFTHDELKQYTHNELKEGVLNE